MLYRWHIIQIFEYSEELLMRADVLQLETTVEYSKQKRFLKKKLVVMSITMYSKCTKLQYYKF